MNDLLTHSKVILFDAPWVGLTIYVLRWIRGMYWLSINDRAARDGRIVKSLSSGVTGAKIGRTFMQFDISGEPKEAGRPEGHSTTDQKRSESPHNSRVRQIDRHKLAAVDSTKKKQL